MTIYDYLKFIKDPNHLPEYLGLFIVFLLLTFNGYVLFYLVTRTKNKLIGFSGGMITGALILLLILGIVSYVFKGPTAIKILFGLYTLASYSIFRKRKLKLSKLLLFKVTKRNSIYVFCLALILLSFLLYTRSAPAGGDVSTHWPLATSFARGNYPTVLPWQPQFLTAYHEGGFLVEGAINSIAGANISLTHFAFSFYIVSALFIFIVGICREKTRGLIGILPAVMGTIIFGGPVLFLGSLSGFMNIITKQPLIFGNLVASLGSSANGIGGLYYYNFYTFGLCTFLLVVYLLLILGSKRLLIKYLILISCAILTLSISEVFFIPEALFICFFYFKVSRQINIKTFIKNSIILFIVFISLFFTIQNIIRDNIVAPDIGKTKFEIAKPGSDDFKERIRYSNMRKINLPDNNGVIYLPNLFLITILILLFGIYIKSYWTIVFSVTALVSFVFAFLLIDPYWRPSSLRFINTAYQFEFLAYGMFLVTAFYSKTKKIVKITAIVLLLIILPQTFSGSLDFFRNAIYKDNGNLMNYVGKKNPTLEWIAGHIAYNKRIIFVDDYPFIGPNSPMTSDATIIYGLFVPTGPLKYKLISVDTSGEWYDAVTDLSPSALKDLAVDLVFIKTSALNRFSPARLNQIANSRFFDKIYENSIGKLYRVSTSFKNLKDDEMTLKKMAELIPDDKIVYLDRDLLPMHDIRKGFLVELSDRTKLLGPMPHLGSDYFLYIAANLPIKATDIKNSESLIPELKSIDYVLMPTGADPNLKFEGKFTKLAEIPFMVLWKNTPKK